MRRLGAENLIPLDLEMKETFRRIRRDKRATMQWEHHPMENMEDFREGVGCRMGDGVTLDTTQMDNVLRPIRDHVCLLSTTQLVIRRPAIPASNFKLKFITLHPLQGVQYIGLPYEDPNAHILNFLEVCDIVKYNGVSDDAIHLLLYPFSLKDKAKHWLTIEPPDSITSWDELVNKFLTWFFLPAKATKLRIDINNLCQLDGESFYEAWERYKDLLRKFPNHNLPKWMQVHHFYNGLSVPIRTLIDASMGGVILRKNEVEAYQILENIALKNFQWPTEITVPKKVARVHDLDAITNLAAEIYSLSKQLQAAQLHNSKASTHMVQATPSSCESCHGPHLTTECHMMNPMGEFTIEQAHYLAKFPSNQNFNPYAQNFNPSWRSRPNFSGKNSNAGNSIEQMKPSPPP